ncbi:MAG: methyltransferase domain-containing protein [Microcoleaceae cyanobacterium]
MENIALGFQSPEKTNEPKLLFDFLDKYDELDSVRACKQQMLNFLGIQEGYHILDVGCGIGHELERMQQMVGSNGLVMGVDKSKVMIEEAKKRANELNLPVKSYVGDANALGINNR